MSDIVMAPTRLVRVFIKHRKVSKKLSTDRSIDQTGTDLERNSAKSHVFERSGTDWLKNPDKTRTFLKIRPDARTGAEEEDVSGETRTYGNQATLGPVKPVHRSEPYNIN